MKHYSSLFHNILFITLISFFMQHHDVRALSATHLKNRFMFEIKECIKCIKGDKQSDPKRKDIYVKSAIILATLAVVVPLLLKYAQLRREGYKQLQLLHDLDEVLH